MPINIKHKAAPKGSSMIPINPSLRNAVDAPITVSEPNHVANKPAATTDIGIRRLAMTKSLVFLTKRDAHQPMNTVIII